MSFDLFKNNVTYKSYIYKQDLALNNPQGLICHKTQPKQNLALYRLFIEQISGK